MGLERERGQFCGYCVTSVIHRGGNFVKSGIHRKLGIEGEILKSGHLQSMIPCGGGK